MAPVRLIGYLGRGSILTKNATSSQTTILQSRSIAGKAIREKIDKPKPFPYDKKEYSLLYYFLGDKTTRRFDENTKVIVVEGAHALGKSKFAQELADELDMKYYPQVTTDMFYKSPCGKIDMRDYNDYFLPRNKTFDEKDFARNPLGSVPKSLDRQLHLLYMLKYFQYLEALRHIFNTGQGVVLEKSPFSQFVLNEAAYRAGWIDKRTMKFFSVAFDDSLHHLLRPNLIIYLDAPVDVVQKKIAERNNEWDKNSPVWSNTNYLNDIYNGMKKKYLMDAKGHSQVLVYDWSEPGETDVVVEDIERLNFDYYGLHEDQQRDWRLYNEELTTKKRIQYSQFDSIATFQESTFPLDVTEAHYMYYTTPEKQNLEDVGRWFPGYRYAPFYNPENGDSVMFKVFSNFESKMKSWMFYPFGRNVLPMSVKLENYSPK